MTVDALVIPATKTTSRQELRDLVLDESAYVRRQVAANVWTPAEVVTSLASDRDWRTRAVVAARPDLPAATGVALVGDKIWQVRFALADNQHVGPVVWGAIATATRMDIRKILVQNSWLPEDISELMCSDPSKDVRQTLAVCTSHREVLTRLLADGHHDVRSHAVRNDLVTEADIVTAAHDRHYVVRAHAGQSPLLPAIERDRLLVDRSRWVRSETVRPPYVSHPVPMPSVDKDHHGPDLTNPQVLASWPLNPTKPRTRWLKLFPQYRPNQDLVPDHVVWFWRYSRRIDRDPAWISWWAPSSARNLAVVVRPIPVDYVELQHKGVTLHVLASSPETFALLIRSEMTEDRVEPATTEQIVDLLLPSLQRAFVRVGQEEGLGEPPPLPPMT